MGRFCILCGRSPPNGAFGGKGRRARICRKCRGMPREKQDELLHEREICGFLEQSHISKKNVARLRTLAQSGNAHTAGLAAVVLEVALVAPYRRRRIRNLARERRDLLKRMVAAGFIREDTDPIDIDPGAAWDEWVEFANRGVHESDVVTDEPVQVFQGRPSVQD